MSLIWLQILTLKSRQEDKYIEKEFQARRMRINAGPPSKLRAQIEAEVMASSDLGSVFETVLSDDSLGTDMTTIQIKYLIFLKKRIASEKDKTKVGNGQNQPRRWPCNYACC